MRVLQRITSRGLLVRSVVGRREGFYAKGEVVAVERCAFVGLIALHLVTGERSRILTRRRLHVEWQLKRAGYRLVDEYGALIDESQLALESSHGVSMCDDSPTDA
jgi:hypothetical protein